MHPAYLLRRFGAVPNVGVIITNHHLWHSGVREPASPPITILRSVVEERNRRGQQSREEHNQLREFRAKRRFEAPLARQERKRIFGYYEDKTGKTFTKAQIKRFVDQIREGHVPTDAIDKDSLVYHPPESQKDMIDSTGEVYIPRLASYPALGIGEGEVIRDPKIPFEHPVLK
jgi:hypothetical protein